MSLFGQNGFALFGDGIVLGAVSVIIWIYGERERECVETYG